MTAQELKSIIISPEFQAGLEGISSYLASVMQEGPIIHLIAKSLWEKKQAFALERNKRHDLTVWTPDDAGKQRETTIEFKFNFETCSIRLKKELGELDTSIRTGVASAKKKTGFAVMPRIQRDVLDKKPDIFVWIICSRDLRELDPGSMAHVVNWKPLKKYRRDHEYKTDQKFLTVIDGLLEVLRVMRPFEMTTAEVETQSDFASTYHFRICEFAPESR